MTKAGWIFIAVAWSFIITMVVICFRRILSEEDKKPY
jgi:glycerol uptake facilitator-like aquaporin